MLINDLYFLYLHNKIAYITYLVGKTREQRRITPESAEQTAKFHHVRSQDGVSLSFCDVVGKPLPGKNLMTPSHIGPVFFLTMPALIVFRASDCPLQRWQLVYGQLGSSRFCPMPFLPIDCCHGRYQQYDDKHPYVAHFAPRLFNTSLIISFTS